MSLLFNIEGPKGSGKSTLSRYMSNKYNATLEYFDSVRVVTDDDFSLNNLKDKKIFERGMLSYSIYGWLHNAQLTPTISRNFSNIEISTWSPLSKMHFDKLMSTIKYKYVVLYSSKPEILTDRIEHRFVSENKGATKDEFDVLLASNEMFKMWGQFLQYLYPDKVLLIDIAEVDDVESLVDIIEGSCENEIV